MRQVAAGDCRDANAEHASAAFAVGERHLAALGLDDSARDREAEPGARYIGLASGAPVEGLEDALSIRRADATSSIRDGELEPGPVPCGAHFDWRALRRELGRVLDQVHERPKRLREVEPAEEEAVVGGHANHELVPVEASR